MATAAVSVPPLRLPSVPTTPASPATPHQCSGGGNGSTPRGRILKDGWMEKKGSRVKKWRRRYFILVSDPRELRYFDGEKLKGTIDMGQVKAIGRANRACSKSPDHSYSFELHTAKRIYYISCDSEEELLSWMSEIRQLLMTRNVGGAQAVDCASEVHTGSVSGAESGGEDDSHGSISKADSGVRFYLTPRQYNEEEDDDHEESESEGMDESEILPESGELPCRKAPLVVNHNQAIRKPRTFPKKDGAVLNKPGNRDTLTDHDRMPAVKAIITDSLIMCQLKLTEDRKHFLDNASTMSREDLVAFVRQLKKLNEELGLGSSTSGNRSPLSSQPTTTTTPRFQPTTPRS